MPVCTLPKASRKTRFKKHEQVIQFGFQSIPKHYSSSGIPSQNVSLSCLSSAEWALRAACILVAVGGVGAEEMPQGDGSCLYLLRGGF